MPWQYVFCVALALCCGSIPFGYIIAKAKGVDVSKQGSGNIGATNVMRTVGRKAGILCLVLDVLKGFIPVAVALNLILLEGRGMTVPLGFLHKYALLIPQQRWDVGQAWHVITALCAVFGHMFSPWMKFRGGKGIATTAGCLLAFMPIGLLVLLVLWGVVLALTKYVSLASIIGSAAMPIITLYGSWRHGYLQNGTWNKSLFAFTVLIAVLVIWKHRSNITRLRRGTEPRVGDKRKQH